METAPDANLVSVIAREFGMMRLKQDAAIGCEHEMAAQGPAEASIGGLIAGDGLGRQCADEANVLVAERPQQAGLKLLTRWLARQLGATEKRNRRNQQ